MRELRKYFVVGDHVKVVAGRHEGETGLVVRIETNLAVLLSDLTYNEVGIGRESLNVLPLWHMCMCTVHVSVEELILFSYFYPVYVLKAH